MGNEARAAAPPLRECGVVLLVRTAVPEYAEQLGNDAVAVLVQLQAPVPTDDYPRPLDALAWVLPVVVLLVMAGLLRAWRSWRNRRGD
jgi:hypothetical protein